MGWVGLDSIESALKSVLLGIEVSNRTPVTSLKNSDLAAEFFEKASPLRLRSVPFLPGTVAPR